MGDGMSTRETPREQSRRMFADAMTVTTTTNLVALVEHYARALATTTNPDQLADIAADLAAVTDEIERRTRR